MKNNGRLFSLDLLRGLDMFLLTVIGPIFWSVHRLHPLPDWATEQFRHPWGGFTLWDLIMPLFIFMCGAAVPYALSKRKEKGRPTCDYWGHVALRVLALWVCGLLVQGDLAKLDVNRLYPFSNTLQSIAVGYLVAAVVFAVRAPVVRILAPILLAGIYGVLLHFLGDYTTTGNFAFVVEKKVLAAILPASSQIAQGIAALTDQVVPGTSKFHYTWWLTSLMFAAMTLCGALCAEILRAKVLLPRRRALLLYLVGAILLGAGWALVSTVPPIKHIFTVSFSCQAMGWCAFLLATLYVLTDILQLRAGLWLFTLYGQCALTAYMASHFFRGAIQKTAEAVVQGVPHLLGADAPNLPPELSEHLQNIQGVVVAVTSALVLTFVLWIRRRLRVAAEAKRAAREALEAEAAPAGKTLDSGNGAVADRYRIPAPDPEDTPAPRMASKVRLQLHKKEAGAPAQAEAPTVELKPLQR